MAAIYALVDSRSPGLFRYVGKTARSPEARLRDHANRARRGGETHRCAWFRSVLNAGAQVSAVTLEACTEAELNGREMSWIAELRAMGHKLTNHTDGGDGSTNMDDAVRAKLRSFRLGRTTPPETRQKISASLKGRPSPTLGTKHTEASREKMRASAQRIPRTEEVKLKIANTKRGVKRTAAVCAIISRSQTGHHIGSKNRSAVLSEADAQDIYTAHTKSGDRISALAQEYKVSRSAIERILSGKSWAHLNLKERFG